MEVEEQQEEDLEVPQARQEAWLFPNGFTTWPPVTLTSPTTSCGATNTGRRLTDWPLIAKVGLQLTNACTQAFGKRKSFYALAVCPVTHSSQMNI